GDREYLRALSRSTSRLVHPMFVGVRRPPFGSGVGVILAIALGLSSCLRTDGLSVRRTPGNLRRTVAVSRVVAGVAFAVTLRRGVLLVLDRTEPSVRPPARDVRPAP